MSIMTKLLWFDQGLLPYEVQKLAGHVRIDTTMPYYLAVKDTIVDRARAASSTAWRAILLRSPENEQFGKKQAISTTPQVIDIAGLTENRGERT